MLIIFSAYCIKNKIKLNKKTKHWSTYKLSFLPHFFFQVFCLVSAQSKGQVNF